MWRSKNNKEISEKTCQLIVLTAWPLILVRIGQVLYTKIKYCRGIVCWVLCICILPIFSMLNIHHIHVIYVIRVVNVPSLISSCIFSLPLTSFRNYGIWSLWQNSLFITSKLLPKQNCLRTLICTNQCMDSRKSYYKCMHTCTSTSLLS